MQLTKSEEKCSSVELDFKNLQQRLLLAEREIVHLKEEVCGSSSACALRCLTVCGIIAHLILFVNSTQNCPSCSVLTMPIAIEFMQNFAHFN